MAAKQYNYIDPLLIPLRERFVKAFAMNPVDLENITKSISLIGWDNDQPVVLARIGFFVGVDVQKSGAIYSDNVFLIDGHTRRQGAINNHKSRITYIIKSFHSEDAAFDYIQGLQFNRRNLTDKDKLSILLSDPDGIANAKNKKQYIAEKLHCSERSAAKFMAILKDPEKLDAIMNEKESLNTAITMSTEKERKSKYASVIRKIENADDITPDEVIELEKVVKELKKKMRGMT